MGKWSKNDKNSWENGIKMAKNQFNIWYITLNR